MANLELLRTLMLVAFLFFVGCMTVEEEKTKQKKRGKSKTERTKIRN